ncbi:MAG: hypothetical protein WDM79_12925 [Terricaulis sp.]
MRGPRGVLRGFESVYALARAAIAGKTSLTATLEKAGSDGEVDVRAAEAEGRLLSPIDHPDPAHLFVTGTGLTHLGSAEGRDKMHRDLTDRRDAHRFHEDVQTRPRRRQAKRRPRGRAA